MKTRLALSLLLAGCYTSNPGTPPPTTEADAGDVPDAGATPLPPPTGSFERLPAFGGTMTALAGGSVLVAHPADRTLYVVDPAREVRHRVALEVGDVPGRAVQTPDGLAHVALRSGDVVSVDVAAGAITRRVSVCADLRGIDYQAARDRLVVTCLGGAVLSLDDDGIGSLGDHGPGLRDVVANGERLFVSRFRTAELLVLDADGALVETQRPATQTLDGGRAGLVTREPNVAYRIRPDGPGVMMVHQMSTTSAIDVEVSGYAGGGRCPTGVVAVALTRFAPGVAPVSSGPIAGATVVTDFAIAHDGVHLASAAEEQTSVMLPTGSVRVGVDQIGGGDPSCAFGDGMSAESFLATEALPDGSVVSLSTSSTRLVYFSPARPPATVQLGAGEIVQPRGYHLFHSQTPAGVACASCHPEGGDDGITWRFLPVGPRRTQSLLGGLLGTEPFHRSGDVADMTSIMQAAFADRMGHPFEAADVTAVGAWLDAQRETPGAGPATAEGRAHFEERCAGCHAGARSTDNQNHDVGTGESFQTPSLAGITYRAPFLHDGCASTLDDTLDGSCAADAAHTVTDPAVREALVAHLRSL